MAANQDEPGARMRAEIAQHPDLWERMLHRSAEIAGRVVAGAATV